MKEIELIDDFCEYLKEKGYKFKRELHICIDRRIIPIVELELDLKISETGLYNKRVKSRFKTVDVVIFDGVLIAVEAKVEKFKELLFHAQLNCFSFPFSYALYSKKPTKVSLKALKETTVGLIILEGDEFKIIKKPSLNYKIYYNGTKMRWDKNTIGRHFSHYEFPENYSLEKIKQREEEGTHYPNHRFMCCSNCNKKYKIKIYKNTNHDYSQKNCHICDNKLIDITEIIN